MVSSATATHGSVSQRPSDDRPGVLRRIADGVIQFFVGLDRAILATHDIERLSRLSESQLAARGLDRADLSRLVFERYYGAPKAG